MPADLPLLRNEPLSDDHARVLRTVLARDTAIQSHLERQHIEMENEVSKAQDIVSSLVTCQVASKRVHQALDALRAAVTESKDLISNTINVHDTEAETADKMTTTTAARNAWGDLIQLLEVLTPQINDTIASTKSHVVKTSDQVSTYKFLAECTRDSIAALDVSLKAIATSLSFKRRGLSSIFRIPNEVLEIVFQFAVEEEREQLRAEFSSSSFSFSTLDDMKRTIPKCPFTLAAVCRRWRNIALHTPRLWSYIRVYTITSIAPRKSMKRSQSQPCFVGKTAFKTSLKRAKGTPLELVIYEGALNQIHIPQDIPSDARISTIHLVRLASVPCWLPSCSHLSLVRNKTAPWWFSGGITLNRDEIPSFLTGPKEISCNNVLPEFLTPLDSTTAFYFCSEGNSWMPNLDHLSENFPNLNTLQLRLPDVSVHSKHSNTIIPRTWGSLTTLIVTSSVLPRWAAHAQQGLSLPSLTTLILTNVFKSFSANECENLKYMVQTLTSLEIHDISPSVKPTELRAFIDWMECLQTVVLHRAPVQKTVKALSIAPAKPIKKLVIESTILEGVELRDYVAFLENPENESGDSESFESALATT